MKRILKLVTFGLATAVCLCGALVATGCTSSQAYTPPEPTAKVTTPALGKDGVLRVGINTKQAPLGAKSTSGNIVGIDVDVAAALADELGLKLEIVDVTSDPAAALKESRVDIVMGFDSAEAVKGVWLSDVYLPTAIALFALEGTNDVPKAGSKDFKIAAQVSKKSAWAVSNEFDQEVLLVADQPKDVFNELKSGNAKYAASDAVVGAYTSRSMGMKTHIVALMQQPSGYSLGLGDANAELKTKVSEALGALQTKGVITVIQKKWLGTSFDFTNIPLTEGATKAQDEEKKNEDKEATEEQTEGEATDAANNTAETIAAITGSEGGNQAAGTEGATPGAGGTGAGTDATAPVAPEVAPNNVPGAGTGTN